MINGGYMSRCNERLRWGIGCSNWVSPSSKMNRAQKWRGWWWLKFLHFIRRHINVKKGTLWFHYNPSKKETKIGVNINQTCTFNEYTNKYGKFVRQTFVLWTRNDSSKLWTKTELQLCCCELLTCNYRLGRLDCLGGFTDQIMSFSTYLDEKIV